MDLRTDRWLRDNSCCWEYNMCSLVSIIMGYLNEAGRLYVDLP